MDNSLLAVRDINHKYIVVDVVVKMLKEAKAKEIKGKIGGGTWSLFWTIICVCSFLASEHGALGLLIVLSFFCAAGGWVALVMTNGSEERIERDIKVASRSIEEYEELYNYV